MILHFFDLIFDEGLPLPSSCSPFFIWTVSNKKALLRETNRNVETPFVKLSSFAGLLRYSMIQCCVALTLMCFEHRRARHRQVSDPVLALSFRSK